MSVPETYVKGGALTEDGKAVKQWIEAQFAEADKTNDLQTLNMLGGYASHYYVNVFKGGGKGLGMTAEQWFEEFKPGADNAWRAMTTLQEQAEAEEAKREQVDGLEETLATVKDEMLKEIRTLKSQNTKLLNRVKALEAGDDGDETDEAEDKTPGEETDDDLVTDGESDEEESEA